MAASQPVVLERTVTDATGASTTTTVNHTSTDANGAFSLRDVPTAAGLTTHTVLHFG